MKIAISSVGDNLDAQVSPILGRCAYFLFVDSETMACQAHPNAAAGAAGGAGIQAAQFIVQQGADALLTGNIGPNAMQVIQAADVPVYPVWTGTARQAVEALTQGKLQPTNVATTPADTGKAGAAGLTAAGGAGLGRGMGQGRGGGRGQGRGAGGGRGGGGGGQR